MSFSILIQVIFPNKVMLDIIINFDILAMLTPQKHISHLSSHEKFIKIKNKGIQSMREPHHIHDKKITLHET